MQTAVRDAVTGSFDIDHPPVESAPPHDKAELADTAVLARSAAPFSGRVFTARRDGRTAFEGSFEDAYTWAVTPGTGLVTLTSFSPTRQAA